VLVLCQGEIARQWYRRWYIYPLWAFAFFGVLAVWTETRERFLGYNVLIMRSEAMAPTIENGDIIFVDAWAFAKRQPQVHDVVAGKDVQIQQQFLRRVTAVDSSGVSLRSDNITSPAAQSRVDLAQISGRARYVLWSSAPGRIGYEIR
jgi:hypothetical protein